MSHRAQFGVFISSGLQFLSESPLRRTHTPPTTKVEKPTNNMFKDKGGDRRRRRGRIILLWGHGPVRSDPWFSWFFFVFFGTTVDTSVTPLFFTFANRKPAEWMNTAHFVRSVRGSSLASVVDLSSIQVIQVVEDQTGVEHLEQELTLSKLSHQNGVKTKTSGSKQVFNHAED